MPENSDPSGSTGSAFSASPPTRVDLHSHTIASDGILTPELLVDFAVERGIGILAVTDHDTTNGLAEAISRAAGRVELWPGVELSTDVPGSEVHVLGYFIDYQDVALNETLARLRESRLDRGEEIVRRLNELGLPVSWERVRELAGAGAVGRPHIAQAMVEAGHVATFRDAFDHYIGRNGPAYVERVKLTPPESIDLILRSGGMPVLAHPTYIAPEGDKTFDLRGYVAELLPAGLVGIEAYYGSYTPEQSREMQSIAAELGLIPTGGTDYHGGNVSSTMLGDVEVPWATVERMRAWRAGRR